MWRFLCLLLLMTWTSNAQDGIEFKEGTFPELMAMAKAANKPLMLMCYAEWCPHCKKMKSEVLNTAEVASFFNANFICAAKDMEIGEGISIRRKLSVKAYPTFVFMSPDGKLLYQVAKELNAKDFIQEGKNALDESKQFPYLKKLFFTDVSNADNCLTYIYALKKANLDAEPIAAKYFATVAPENLVSDVNWKIFANGITDINSREFQHVLQNQEKYATVSSPTRVERKILFAAKEKLSAFAEAGDTVKYLNARPSVAAINLRKTDSLLFNYDLKVYELAGDWTRYQNTALEKTKDFAWNNQRLLTDISLNFSQHVTDKTAVEQSIAWAERSLELKTAYDIYLILANLNLKIGNKSAATNWAQQGRAMAIEHKWDPIKADEILKRI